MRETLYIRDAAGMARLIERLDGAEHIAIDTEFMRERTYYARLCLVQIATERVLAAVDPLADIDLTELWRLLTGGPELILHAAGQDLEIIAGLAGGIPARHFDTQVAAAFLGYGNSIGYSKLVERVMGRSPGRSEAYTDWTRRPLSQEQLDYALDDVRYLLEIAERLETDLEEMGRSEWVREELAATAAAVRSEAEPEQMWRRVRGTRSFKGRNLAILQEVAAWREREAQRRDIPRQRVLPDRVIAEIARRAPKRRAQIDSLRGMHPREAERSAQDILEAVQRGLERREDQQPSWGAAPPSAGDPRVDMMAALLDAVLRGVADDMRLSSRLLANRADLEELVRYRLADGSELPDIPVLTGWRRASVGSRLLEVLDGEVALVIERDPHSGPQLRLRPL